MVELNSEILVSNQTWMDEKGYYKQPTFYYWTEPGVKRARYIEELRFFNELVEVMDYPEYNSTSALFSIKYGIERGMPWFSNNIEVREKVLFIKIQQVGYFIPQWDIELMKITKKKLWVSFIRIHNFLGNATGYIMEHLSEFLKNLWFPTQQM